MNALQPTPQSAPADETVAAMSPRHPAEAATVNKFKLLDLFSGIGGFSLGLERSGGFETVAFCEIDPFCRKVLKKHWPKVPCYDDVRSLTAERLASDGIAVDAICGGFPCQDISDAGLRAGIEGERSGLWAEYARIISELRPRYVIVENVAALLSRGLGRVLGDLASLGFDAEWHCIPACYVGSPQQRDRIWIVANSESSQARRQESSYSRSEAPKRWKNETPSLGRRIGMLRNENWNTEPKMGRVVDGVSPFVDEVSRLGNAVVPQIPELIGRAILSSELAP